MENEQEALLSLSEVLGLLQTMFRREQVSKEKENGPHFFFRA